MVDAAPTSRLLFVLTFTSMLAGCGTSTTTVLSPAALSGRCGVAIGVSGSSFAASGGTGTLSVQAARECPWSVTERPAWITLSATPALQGALEVSFAVEPNRSTTGRTGELVIADQRARITQEAATCPWTITPSHATLGASGGDVRARLSTEDFCSWEAVSPAGWVVVEPQRGQGSTDITFEVRANTGDKRIGTLRVGGAAVEIEQRQAPPTAPVPPASPSPPKPPQPPSPPAEPEPTLPPAPVPDVPAPQPPAPPSPAPPAPPPVVVPPPPPPVVVPPPPVIVPPPPPVVVPPPPPTKACTYSVSPLQIEVSRKSRRVDVSIVTQSSCTVRATSNASWLEVSTDTQTGGGKLRLDVDHNRDRSSRTGEVTLTGEGFTAKVIVLQKGK